MEFLKQFFLLATISNSLTTSLASSIYGPGPSDSYPAQSKQKIPAILMHKQELSGDGSFNFAFAGDNGIKRGESIHPDGTRQGAYSYVDPNGETVSVKYQAGKDGFKILEGPIPQAPVAAPFVSALHEAASSSSKLSAPLSSRYSSSAEENNEDYSFGPTGSYSHHRAKVNAPFKGPAPAAAPVYKVYEDSSAEHYHQAVPFTPSRSARYEADEDSRGPHTFGKGYSFEFGSGSS